MDHCEKGTKLSGWRAGPGCWWYLIQVLTTCKSEFSTTIAWLMSTLEVVKPKAHLCLWLKPLIFLRKRWLFVLDEDEIVDDEDKNIFGLFNF